MRFSSLIAGTNHAVLGSLGCTATAKPNVGQRSVVTTLHDLAASVVLKMPLWCCTHMLAGSDLQETRRCGSWMLGSSRRWGGMYSANMPAARVCQLRPPSAVFQTPPQETPTDT